MMPSALPSGRCEAHLVSEYQRECHDSGHTSAHLYHYTSVFRKSNRKSRKTTLLLLSLLESDTAIIPGLIPLGNPSLGLFSLFLLSISRIFVYTERKLFLG